MYQLNELEIQQVAGGSGENNPDFDAPVSEIYRNYRNAGASVAYFEIVCLQTCSVTVGSPHS